MSRALQSMSSENYYYYAVEKDSPLECSQEVARTGIFHQQTLRVSKKPVGVKELILRDSRLELGRYLPLDNVPNQVISKTHAKAANKEPI